MNEYTVDNLAEFEEVLFEFNLYRDQIDTTSLGASDYFLFRGQACHEWALETTLERFVTHEITLSKYYNFALAAKSRVETFTEQKWELETPSQFKEWIKKQKPLVLDGFTPYEYFAYLRHHGYPSPFLDWTMSPYIALFFALRNMIESHQYASVIIYLEHVGQGKIGDTETPFIHRFGPYANIHSRHYLQQSNYTICVQKTNDDLTLKTHHDFLENPRTDQDILFKINFPYSQKNIILEKLNLMNINAYSLMGSVDSLMETTAAIERKRL